MSALSEWNSVVCRGLTVPSFTSIWCQWIGCAVQWESTPNFCFVTQLQPSGLCSEQENGERASAGSILISRRQRVSRSLSLRPSIFQLGSYLSELVTTSSCKSKNKEQETRNRVVTIGLVQLWACYFIENQGSISYEKGTYSKVLGLVPMSASARLFRNIIPN